MTENTSTTWDALPSVVTRYLTAHRVRDVSAAISGFTADAAVTDEGQTFRGREAIGTWLGSAGSEYTFTTEFTGATVSDPMHVDVVQRLEGNFPGGVADLHYRFTLAGDAISRLVIEPMTMTTRNWFITGGTPGGFGMAYAEAALEIGDRVVLTARRPGELETWARTYGDRVLVLPLDVTDAQQVQGAVLAAEEHFGGIDVLVNNAGRGWYGSIEGQQEAEVRAMFELNFFSVLTVIRAALPGMRARGSGWILNMSSVAGLRATTGFGYYSATKSAIEAVTATLREEVEPLGIRVMAVEPGAFRTRAYAGFADEPIVESVTEYQPVLEQVRAVMIEQDGVQPGDPQRGVRAVIAAMAQDPPPRRLILGRGGFDAVVATLEDSLAEISSQRALSQCADFPTDH